ncbi:ATP-binding cassette domain-containing protein [Clostridium oryzae]|uniref:Putative ABC transporter ATP-binding protein YxlF n=1 Tax=Clostridium oryzae TaxID=1450648 RepID=A0A1V4IZ02_9CLOT|nr:ATP-binding cassette domain-containing protein [Clostridium oryzae]OPJ64627.1 putative ABC transporter ATP-binding protein YxlF [Clostridium oryzae]
MKIEIKDLQMTYKGGQEALKNINISLKSPSLIGLLGPNGAGKSTLMKLMVARLLQTSGSISVDGQKLLGNEKYIKSKLGYLSQDFGLYDELTIKQFLEYMASLKGIGRNLKEEISKVINATNLSEKKNAKIRTLSGGQRQRVGIAQALLGNPELLILDEPTVGLDPEERVKFRNLFSESAKDKIVILSTHIIEDVQAICNRLIVINRGCILFDGKPQELIRMAEGHVGVCEVEKDKKDVIEKFKVTSRVFTTRGMQYRIVGKELPGYAEIVEPSLEDAYVFLMSKEGIHNESVCINNK